ncbi:MAG: oxidoreductase [Candidatus Roseilinea sp.]|nr:MAG: oxidoreductase [Candidatus Roseilinea sp.]GIV84401.1 MAG: oxidoreductase [Candidatus Roseilinea sp.]
MTRTLTPNYKPKLPPKIDYGIGIVGCGGIVNYAHLVAYKNNGLRVVACHDANPEAAQKTAEAHGIPKVYQNLDDLLADPAVEIVDIAVQPWHQRAIAERALAAGKHLLCQKPLSDTFGDAVAIVEAGRRAGRKVAVNQQMRWDAGIAAAQDLIAKGVIGRPTDAQIQVSTNTPWHMWPWLAESPRLEVLYHSIHYLDAMRFLFGEPAWVTSRHAKYPKQGAKAETKTITILDYADGLQAMVAVNHHDESPDGYATFRFLGTEGIIKGTIGLMYNYPHGRPDTFEVHLHTDKPEDWHVIPLAGMWIPDAFIGPMASLMEAIQTDGMPATDAADNLNTLRIVEAAYRSAAENRSVRPTEI